VASLNEIKSYIIAEFAPDVSIDELDADYDLLENGVVDSLGLLQLIGWVGDRFDLPVTEIDLSPADFRSAQSIQDFVEIATETTSRPLAA
jgi:acyl carrier protein